MNKDQAQTSNELQGARGGMDRRDLLKKSAVAGGIIWTTPVLLSAPAAAAGTPGRDVCPPGKGKTRTTEIEFQWNPGDCSGGEDLGCRDSSDDALTSCSGDSSGWAGATVTAADGMTVTGSPVTPGNAFTVATDQANNVTITLSRVGGTGTQTLTLHISCSDPICVGDRYGPLTIIDGF